MKSKLKKAVQDIRRFQEPYQVGRSEGELMMPPTEDLINIDLLHKTTELPEGYPWFSNLLMNAPDYRWIDLMAESAEYKDLKDLLKKGRINPETVAYRSGYFDGLCNVISDVFRKTKFLVSEAGAHIEHSVTTDEDAKALRTGLAGEPLKNKFGMEEITTDEFSFTKPHSSFACLYNKYSFVYIRPWKEIKPTQAYLLGLSFALWRDFRYQLAESEHFIVNEEAFDAFSRGLTGDRPCKSINGHGLQKVANENAYKLGGDIAKYLLSRFQRYDSKVEPVGFQSIPIKSVYKSIGIS